MKKQAKVIISMAVIAIAIVIFWPSAPKQNCLQSTDAEVQEKVKNAFVSMLPRWSSAQEQIGTSAPSFSWGKIPRGATPGKDDTLMVPFTASGPEKSHGYTGIYVCDTGHIEFSVD
ncbi:YebF family protein [Serratia ureilytica]|uniref:YebF family protein n=1 Tax=Serratia ureilytica TaxID=300181 RepID=UPI0019D1CB29|nr:YebF family protein [Serratia ureilytica]MBN5215744.1 hypothetical protein [Serratia ureilytica]